MTVGLDLDLSWGAELPVDVAERYDRLCNKFRNEFVELVDTLSEHVGGDIDWWVEGPASRNHVLSPLFHNFIALKLLRECIDSGAVIGTVYVDSVALHKTVRELLSRSAVTITLEYRHTVLKRFEVKMKSIASPFRSMGRLLAEWVIIRMTRPREKRALVSRDVDYILLDTFILPPGPKQGDRYYPGLLENVSDAVQVRIRFVPQFFGFKLNRLSNAVKEARDDRGKFLLKEDLLGPKDLAWCFLHWVRLRHVKVAYQFVDDVNMAPLVLEEFRSGRSFRCAMRGLLNYRFAAAMKRAGARISDVIDWFENHPMDRGWNAGFRRYYGDSTRIKGYLGFFPAFPAARPTPGECAAGVVPEEILAIGPGMKGDVREFIPSLKTGDAPAFRYQWLFETAGVTQKNLTQPAVVVALPYDKSSVEYMLDVIGKAKRQRSDFEILMKPHPAVSLDCINGGEVLRQAGVRQIGGELRNWFPKAFAVICGGMSTSSLEAMASGLPVAVIARPGRCHEVSMPREVPRQMWRVCRTSQELLESLTEFWKLNDENSKRSRSLPERIRTRMFTPVTRESVGLFLSLRPAS